jgi:hypothetical protein
MDTNKLIKYVLIGAAAYLVYRYLKESGVLDSFLGTSTAAQVPVTTQPALIAAPATSAATVAAEATVPAMSNADLHAQLKALTDVDTSGGFAADGVTRTHSFYVYQYYYHQLTGRDLPSGEVLGLDEAGRSRDMTLDEFWALLTAAKSAGQTAGYPGLSALQAIRALSAWTGNGVIQ